MTKIMIDEGYRPTEEEAFMNERQREYFRQKLLAWKEEILREARETLQHLQDESQNRSHQNKGATQSETFQSSNSTDRHSSSLA